MVAKLNPEAAERGLRAASEARRAQAENNKLLFLKEIALSKKMAELIPRKHLPEIALAAATRLAGQILIGAVPVRSASEAANAITALVTVARLEMGESTENSNLTPEEKRARLGLLQDEIAKRRTQLDHPAGVASGSTPSA